MLIDPKALAAIQSLELRARALVDGISAGRHKSPKHGFSVEFSEYRNYTPGDDIKHLDWKVMARTDRPYIKKYDAETNLRAQLLLDKSRSMAYKSSPDGMTKADYAATISATLAWFLMTQGDAIGITTFAEGPGEYLPPSNKPSHLKRIFGVLEKTPDGTGTDVDGVLKRVAEMQHKRGLFVLISDLLVPIDTLESRLSTLHARGHDVAVIQVLDRAELELPFSGTSQITDLESGKSIPIDTATEAEHYKKRFEAHQAAIHAACGKSGIDHHVAITDSPLEPVLREFLMKRSLFGGSKVTRVHSSIRM